MKERLIEVITKLLYASMVVVMAIGICTIITPFALYIITGKNYFVVMSSFIEKSFD